MISREEWLEWRRGGLGGSDVAGVLGVSPWTTPFAVWWSKVHAIEDRDTRSRERGRFLEEAVLKWAQHRLDSDLVRGTKVVHPELNWVRGTPDGWTGVDEGIEAKTCRGFDEVDGWGPDGSDRVPLHYRIQCAWYLALTGARIWRLAAYSTLSDELRIFEILPDPAVEAKLLDTAGTWWETHVLTATPPELDTTSAALEYLRERYANPSDEVLEATEEDLELLERYDVARSRQKDAKREVDEISVELRERIGAAKSVSGGPGELRATWSRFDRSSVDLKTLRKDHPELEELLAQYTRTTASGRLLVSRRKETKK